MSSAVSASGRCVRARAKISKSIDVQLLLFVLDLVEISSRIMAENTTLIDLHLEMFRGFVISTCIKCDSFIYGRALSSCITTSASPSSSTEKVAARRERNAGCTLFDGFLDVLSIKVLHPNGMPLQPEL
jgi:hypothetical protein